MEDPQGRKRSECRHQAERRLFEIAEPKERGVRLSGREPAQS